MPVTADQAQMLTTLAIACRPHGARRWDPAGVMANIRKIADRNLGDVTIAVIQAAEDRNAHTPGVIATNGPHWRAPDPARAPETRPKRYQPHERCGECQQPLERHLADDHDPYPGTPGRGVPGGVRGVIDELKDIVRTSTTQEAP